MRQNLNPLLGYKVDVLKKYDSIFMAEFPCEEVPKDGVGVEFEVEGQGLPNLRYHWNSIRDGSLRGGKEYVLKKPVTLKRFKETCFPYLRDKLADPSVAVNMSERCSVHLHINVRDMCLYQVFAIGILYYICEDFIEPMLGEHRIGNLFCSGGKESTGTITQLIRAAKNQRDFDLLAGGELHKYVALNYTSLSKFGSLEFRALEGTLDQDKVFRWVDFCTALRAYAKKMTPAQVGNILDDMSMQTPSVFVKQVLGEELFAQIRNLHSVDDDHAINSLIYNGIDRVQPLIYEVPWAEVTKEEKKPPKKTKTSLRPTRRRPSDLPFTSESAYRLATDETIPREALRSAEEFRRYVNSVSNFRTVTTTTDEF